jgi:cyclohexa-1,5-dienecarbonyl-CoA hydratase
VSSTVVLERRTDGVVVITLDRPPLNVLDLATLAALADAVERARDADGTALLLTGAGRAFCAGVDVADHGADRVDRMLHDFHAIIEGLLSLEVPVVAGLNGAAFGGGLELALACDVVIARAGAKLGQPEVTLGVFPPAAAVLLPRLVGRQAALDLLLTGRTLTAEEALALGLVSRVAPADDFHALVERYLGSLGALSAPVLRLTKRAVTGSRELPLHEGLAFAERLYREELMRLGDAHEGLSAFLEKRAPVWRHA